MSQRDSLWRRVLRAPIFVPALILSIIATLPVYASVTVGAWVEGLLRRLGVIYPSDTLLAVAGVVLYGVLGLLLPFWLGLNLVGWGGGLLGPLLVLALLAWLGRW